MSQEDVMDLLGCLPYVLVIGTAFISMILYFI